VLRRATPRPYLSWSDRVVLAALSSNEYRTDMLLDQHGRDFRQAQYLPLPAESGGCVLEVCQVSVGIAVRIARKGIETSDKLGRHRWVIERTLAWLTGYRRLTLRYERNASHFLAYLTLAATITCYKKLAKLTT
jgi:hypothetical protein